MATIPEEAATTAAVAEPAAEKVSEEKVVNSTDFVARTSEDNVLRKRGYHLTRLLGEGSYAKVYLAEYKPADKDKKSQALACKVINGNSAPKDFLRRFFPREVEIMSRVNHQYLIRVHSILQRKNKYFLFMQYCENGDILEFIRSHGAIKEKQARIWFCEILQGLYYLHDRNISHRDLKCENILLSHGYNVKISDFGFARYMLPNEGKSETFCGSVSYAAPEIIRGLPYNPKAADIWSTGVILYVMLNKAMPFDDTSLKALYESQMSRTWKFRNKVKELLSTEVKNFLYIILDPNPESRKTTGQLWACDWIQEGSDVDLTINGLPRFSESFRALSKKEIKSQHEAAARQREEEIAKENAPIHIIEADTAMARRTSFYFTEYQNQHPVANPTTVHTPSEPRKSRTKK